jgi:hypothetical protein
MEVVELLVSLSHKVFHFREGQGVGETTDFNVCSAALRASAGRARNRAIGNSLCWICVEMHRPFQHFLGQPLGQQELILSCRVDIGDPIDVRVVDRFGSVRPAPCIWVSRVGEPQKVI